MVQAAEVDSHDDNALHHTQSELQILELCYPSPLLQLPTVIDLLRQLLQSYGISYRLPLDKATVLIVLKGR